ncbi:MULTISPECIES: hypothetical protein [unclassified Nocardiopsis]|uniref:hypothetical protein n=1 Tax=unclassified Nocardiopsis TaxID=2649073 RepID=UPI00135AFCE4|nr:MULTISPECIES: hypothetical protein [unclassified Nocardiopsis]
MLHSSSRHRAFHPSGEGPADIAAATHAALTGWGMPASQVTLLTARVRTLATLLTACSAPQIHLHLLHQEGHIHAQVTAPATVLRYRLPAWQARPGEAHTRYATHADVQVDVLAPALSPGLECPAHHARIPAASDRRSA